MIWKTKYKTQIKLEALQGVHFYDDALYNIPGDLARKHKILVMGANHNFFNTIWTPSMFPAGARDDWLAYIPLGSSDPHSRYERVSREV